MTKTIASDPRLQQLSKWLNDVFSNKSFTLTPLTGDASFRRYMRLFFDRNPKFGLGIDAINPQPNSLLIMDAPPDKESVVEFVAIAKLMAQHVNVPDIIAQDIQQGFLVLQDFGDTQFAQLLDKATDEKIADYYLWAMQTLIDLQSIDISTARHKANLPDYNADRLKSEMGLFDEWFLPFVDIELANHERSLIENFMDSLVNQVIRQPQVVVHRDYHSRNLMYDQHNPDRLGVIDFQDAVIGAYSYDIVSLLRDAYVNWSETQVEAWVGHFWQLQHTAQLPTSISAKTFLQDVNIMGMQRHLKILGIFIRLAQRDGKQSYLNDLPKVMNDLCYELEWLQKNADANIKVWVAPFYSWIQSIVLPKFALTFKD